MKRNIITIDEEKCTGCGLCIDACHEGALKLINGKAKLVSEAYCDGLGNCLPQCPAGAIAIAEKEAAAFDEKAVQEHLAAKSAPQAAPPHQCPGSQGMVFRRKPEEAVPAPLAAKTAPQSQLCQWPVQIKLVSPQASYFRGAHLLVAADCTAFSYANIHEDFIKGRIVVVGCPKLDSADYSEKLTDILKNNDIKSVTVLKMEVPCCGGLENAVKTAVKNTMLDTDKVIPWHSVTISLKGEILDK